MGIDLGVALGAGVEQYNRMRGEDRADKALKFQESAEARAQKEFDNKQDMEAKVKTANQEYYESIKNPRASANDLFNNDHGLFGTGQFKGKQIVVTDLPNGKVRVTGYDKGTGASTGFEEMDSAKLDDMAKRALYANHLTRLSAINPSVYAPMAMQHGISQQQLDQAAEAHAETGRHQRSVEELTKAKHTSDAQFAKDKLAQDLKLGLGQLGVSNRIAGITENYYKSMNPLNNLTPDQSKSLSDALQYDELARSLPASAEYRDAAAAYRSSSATALSSLPAQAQLKVAEMRAKPGQIDPRELEFQKDLSSNYAKHLREEPEKGIIFEGADHKRWAAQKATYEGLLQHFQDRVKDAAVKAPPVDTGSGSKSLGLRVAVEPEATYGMLSGGRMNYLESSEKAGRLNGKEAKELGELRASKARGDQWYLGKGSESVAASRGE